MNKLIEKFNGKFEKELWRRRTQRSAGPDGVTLEHNLLNQQ